MQIAFDTEELRNLCEKSSLANSEFGESYATSLRIALADIRAVENLSVFKQLYPARIEFDNQGIVKLNLKGQGELMLVHNHLNSIELLGLSDLAKVTRIKILGIKHASE